jgi:hypothetical protein
MTGDLNTNGQFDYMKIYPNPSHSLSTLEINMSKNGQVLVNIINIQGHRVKEVCNQELPAGIHIFTIQSHDLEPGIYFSVLKTSQIRQINKFIAVSDL